MRNGIGRNSVPFGTTEEYGNKAWVCDRSVTFARLLTNLEHFSVNERKFSVEVVPGGEVRNSSKGFWKFHQARSAALRDIRYYVSL